jgi:hypothetical protein
VNLPRGFPCIQLLDRRDLEIINRNAGRLNREAVDTLEYQQLSCALGLDSSNLPS